MLIKSLLIFLSVHIIFLTIVNVFSLPIQEMKTL